jgi:hypothetical protein
MRVHAVFHLRHSLLPSVKRYLINLLLKTYVKPEGEVLKRIARFWESRISPLRRTDANTLLVTHGAIITGILRYLRSQNYRINDSIKRSQIDWDKTATHSSITEVALDFDGLGEIIAVGATDHLLGF